MTIKNEQSGRTMIETILYLALIGVLSAGIAKTVSHTFDRYAIGRLGQQLRDLKKSIINYTAAYEDYTVLAGNGFNTMLSHNAIPYDMKNQTHSLGGKIELGCTTNLAPHSSDTKHKYMYYITFNNLSQSACVELLTQTAFYTEGSEADTIIVNKDTLNERSWAFKFSLFYDNTPSTTPQNCNTSDASICLLKNQTLNINQALQSCTYKINNSITWIFS